MKFGYVEALDKIWTPFSTVFLPLCLNQYLSNEKGPNKIGWTRGDLCLGNVAGHGQKTAVFAVATNFHQEFVIGSL